MAPDFTSIAAADAETWLVPGGGAARLRLYRLRGAGRDGTPILLGHCNGFSAGCYLPLLRTLSARHDVYAFDHRGHGGSDDIITAEGAPLADSVANDVGALVEAVAALRPDVPIHYVGHSLSAAALLHLAISHGTRYRQLPLAQVVLIEPPVFPDAQNPLFEECARSTVELVARTRRRRRRWPNREAYVAALRGRGPFAAFAPGMLEQLAVATLRPSDHEFELACAPDTEAAIFSTWGRPILFPFLGQVPDRPAMTLVGGDPDGGPGRDWVTAIMPSVAARIEHLRFFTMKGHGHLWPFEAPDHAASFLLERIAGNLSARDVAMMIQPREPPAVA
jgi:pimeloyl-ACP methyl ester carboxylesterase